MNFFSKFALLLFCLGLIGVDALPSFQDGDNEYQANFYPVDLELEPPFTGVQELKPVVAGIERFFANWLDCNRKSPTLFYYSLGLKENIMDRKG